MAYTLETLETGGTPASSTSSRPASGPRSGWSREMRFYVSALSDSVIACARALTRRSRPEMRLAARESLELVRGIIQELDMETVPENTQRAAEAAGGDG